MSEVKMSEQVEQESLSREHMSKMIRAQTVVMKQVHEDNLALQQENAELRDEVQAKTDLLALVVVEKTELRKMLGNIAVSMECNHGVDTDSIFELLDKHK